DYLEDRIIVKVQDNGKGFNIEEQQLSDGGLGLINVQNRIQLIGGHVLFERMLQNGTIVILELPK
ncbi:MAG: sensor histidine kinase, partial [Bacteroidota bacterium]|nr:sensor histidine kinase [Bacteroidota bacterium]